MSKDRVPSRYNLSWDMLRKQIWLTFFKQCIDEYNLLSDKSSVYFASIKRKWRMTSVNFNLSLFAWKMAQKNPSKIFLANAYLNGLAIDNNQSRTSSKHFDPLLFQNPYKIMAEAESNYPLAITLWVQILWTHALRSPTHYVQPRFITSSPWNISHPTRWKKLAFENNIYRI